MNILKSLLLIFKSILSGKKDTRIKEEIMEKQHKRTEFLSKNFKKSKFMCSCCDELKCDPRLIEALQNVRDKVGKPMILNSGYRCKKKNDSVLGSSKKSQHILGKAADISARNFDIDKLVNLFLLESSIGGIGIYRTKNFVHVDVRDKKPDGTIARW